MEKIITKDGSIAEVEGAEYLHSLRHTASHIMAQAIKHLYGGADGKQVQLAIGPAIDTGFYYDIDMERKLTDEDLADIEREMKNIVKQNLKLERSVLSREDALKKFSDEGEIYKVQIYLKTLKFHFSRKAILLTFAQVLTYFQLAKLKRLSLCRLQGHIGAAMKKIKCYREFTVQPFKLKMNFKIICICLKRRRVVTTVNLARNLKFSACMTKVQAFHFSTQTV